MVNDNPDGTLRIDGRNFQHMSKVMADKYRLIAAARGEKDARTETKSYSKIIFH